MGRRSTPDQDESDEVTARRLELNRRNCSRGIRWNATRLPRLEQLRNLESGAQRYGLVEQWQTELDAEEARIGNEGAV